MTYLRYGWMLSILLLFVPLHTRAGAASARPPHLVLFIADDYTWNDSGAYGATDVRTPNLDRLAHEGMRFDAAFAASPTCTPSRSAIYSGLFPFRSGAHANHSLVRADLHTLPHRLKALGYRVVLAGKTHIGPRPAFPFEYLPGSNVMPEGKNHVLWTDLDTGAVDQLLRDHHQEQPLCLIVCSHSPHVYWPESSAYDPKQIRLPSYLVDTPATRQARCRYYSDVSWMDKQVGEVRDSIARHGFEKSTLFLFTADQGAQFPFAKWNLYDAGIHTPFLAAWPNQIKPGSRTSALVSLVDLLPTLIDVAGGTVPKDIDGKSFLQTLRGKEQGHRKEIFAAHTGDGQMNRSPMRCIRTGRHKLILNLAPENLYKTHITNGVAADGLDYWQSWLALSETDPKAADMIRRYQHRPALELYDLQVDPYEQRNLASDPARSGLLGKLLSKLQAWRQSQGEDLNRVPYPEDARQGDVPYAR